MTDREPTTPPNPSPESDPPRLGIVRADLHVHTVLSPCGEIEQSPGAVAASASAAGLHLLAVTDHNAAENAAAYAERLRRVGIAALYGLEVTTAEEAHLLALFDDVSSALTLQSGVFQRLPGRNDPDVFGMQIVVNAEEDVLGFNEHLLIGSTRFEVRDLVDRIHALGGLAVACHVDREAYSLVGQLGFVPPDLPLDALEVSSRTPLDAARASIPDCARFPLVRNSDAHRPGEVGSAWTEFLVASPTVDELRKALRNADGRRIVAHRPA